MYSALGRVPSGIFILTACRDNAETGILASWVQQCGFNPLMISVAIRADRFLVNWLAEGTGFTLNILDDSQTDMIVHFGRGFGPDDDAFAGLPVTRADCKAPVLEEALAYLDCQVEQRYTPGDHVLVIGQVVGGRMLNEGHPMVHIRKNGSHY
jgi:flavin reductase (DIM6/NTAB) family NADH-FMN oxidoreductase RutF